MLALAGGDVHTGREVLRDHTVLIDDRGVVGSLVAGGGVPDGAEVVDVAGMVVAPGFCDVQVNGGGDVLFSDEPTPEGVVRILDAHRRFGTTHLLPTFATGDPERMRLALAAVQRCVDEGVEGVLGIHFEGPLISRRRIGIHDPAWVRDDAGPDLVGILTGLRGGVTVVTLAPEVAPPPVVTALLAAGVRLSAGHSEATYEQARDAIRSGVTCATHLFNAMSPLTSRAPGVVGAFLADPAAWCGVIADGHHVHPASLRLALRLKPLGRVFLVTDAMPPVGGTGTEFRFGGHRVRVKGRICVTDEGVLGGSMLDMATAVRYVVSEVGVPLEEALRMASTYPARYLGVEERAGLIAPGRQASVVVLDRQIRVRGVVTGPRYEEVTPRAGR